LQSLFLYFSNISLEFPHHLCYTVCDFNVIIVVNVISWLIQKISDDRLLKNVSTWFFQVQCRKNLSVCYVFHEARACLSGNFCIRQLG